MLGSGDENKKGLRKSVMAKLMLEKTAKKKNNMMMDEEAGEEINEQIKPTKRMSKTPPEWTKQAPGTVVIPEENKNITPSNSPTKKTQPNVFYNLKKEYKKVKQEPVKQQSSGIRFFDQNPAKLYSDDNKYKVNPKYQNKVNKILGR